MAMVRRWAIFRVADDLQQQVGAHPSKGAAAKPARRSTLSPSRQVTPPRRNGRSTESVLNRYSLPTSSAGEIAQ